MERPLNGLRVIDISRGVAASFCTMILAEYGAEVIKIESPMGDTIRYGVPLYEGEGTSFIGLNRNKKSVRLNVNEDKDRQLFLTMVPDADVIVENFRPGFMKKLGLDYETIKAINPRIIFCSVSAFGQEGQWSDKAAHDNTLLGLTGMLNGLSGADGTPPQPVPLLAGMVGGSMWAVIGILLAQAERQSTGQGRHVDISIFHGLQAIMLPELVAQAATGRPQTPGRTWNSGSFPGWYGYKTKDNRWMTLAAVEPKFWKNFCELFEAEELKPFGYPYDDKDGRIREKVAAIIKNYTMDELIRLTSEKEVLLEPVYTLEESLNIPPSQDFGTIFELYSQDNVPYPQVRLPLTAAAELPRHLHPSPGQHNSDYLPESEPEDKQ